MSEITLKIGGRSYTVACEAGQEAHLSQLGDMIQAKLTAMGGNPSSQDAQNLLFAALFLADEVHELKSAVPVGQSSKTENAAASSDANHAADLEQIAASLEKLADTLESGATAH